MSEAEARLLGALEWLEREERLPPAIRQYFVDAAEAVLATVVPAKEWASLRGCGDASKYRAAYEAAVERGEFQR